MEILIPVVSASILSGLGSFYTFFQTKKLKKAEARLNIGEEEIKKLLDESDMQIKSLYQLQVLCNELRQSFNPYFNRQYKIEAQNGRIMHLTNKFIYLYFNGSITYDLYEKINHSIKTMTSLPESDFITADSYETMNMVIKSCNEKEETPSLGGRILNINHDSLFILYTLCSVIAWIQIKKRDINTIHANLSQSKKLDVLLEKFANILNIGNDSHISFPLSLQKKIGTAMINQNEDNKYSIMSYERFMYVLYNQHLALGEGDITPDHEHIAYHRDNNKSNDVIANAKIFSFNKITFIDNDINDNFCSDNETNTHSTIGSYKLHVWGFVNGSPQMNYWIKHTDLRILDYFNDHWNSKTPSLMEQFENIWRYTCKLQLLFKDSVFGLDKDNDTLKTIIDNNILEITYTSAYYYYHRHDFFNTLLRRIITKKSIYHETSTKIISRLAYKWKELSKTIIESLDTNQQDFFGCKINILDDSQTEETYVFDSNKEVELDNYVRGWFEFFCDEMDKTDSVLRVTILPYLITCKYKSGLTESEMRVKEYYMTKITPLFKNIVYEWVFRNKFKTLHMIDKLGEEIIQETKCILQNDFEKRRLFFEKN